MKAAHLRAVPPAPTTRRNLTTATSRLRHFQQALREQELSERTVRLYSYDIQHAEWFCEQEGYTLLNVPAIVLAQHVETKPKTYATRLRLRASLTQYWRIFKRKNPPLWVVKVPRRPVMVCRALDEDEAQRLANAAVAAGGREGLAVLLGLYMALRREEISQVRWDDIREDGWLEVFGKGALPARLPLHPVVTNALAGLDRTHAIWTFPGRYPGRHVSPATIWQWIVELADQAGLERITPHRLRHTALATANDNTGDLRATQSFARHANVSTTVNYTRSTAKRLIAVMNAINYDPGAADRLELERRLSAKLGALATEDLAVLVALVEELAPAPG